VWIGVKATSGRRVGSGSAALQRPGRSSWVPGGTRGAPGGWGGRKRSIGWVCRLRLFCYAPQRARGNCVPRKDDACRNGTANRRTAILKAISLPSRTAVMRDLPLASNREMSPQTHRNSSGVVCDLLIHFDTHAYASRPSSRIGGLASMAPTLTPQSNPHSARGTLGATYPAISCLGAFQTPAATARG
jgi:hypothetical protein